MATSVDSLATSVDWQALDAAGLDSLLDSEEGTQSVIGLEGNDAVVVVNLLDKNLPDCEENRKKKYVIALRQLCLRHDILPESCTLQGVELVGDRPVASGDFADVWMGRLGGRDVAVKVLRIHRFESIVTVKQRFIDEVLVWKQLSHPNVLPFLGITDFPSSYMPYCMVSPWMANRNLVHYLKSHPEANRHRLVTDIATGLDHLHSNEIVHGGLKGTDVLVNDDGRAVLSDFGSSRLFYLPAVREAKLMRLAGWMAPELIDLESFGLVKGYTSKESDIYAFGMIIYQIMSGNVPFHKLRTIALIYRVITESRPERPTDVALSSFSDALWEIATDCWKQQPEERPTIGRVLSLLIRLPESQARTDEAHLSFLKELPRVKDAEFLYKTSETDVQVARDRLLLRDLQTWVTDPYQNSIHWLEETMGTNRCSISRQLSEHCFEHDLLGASFFCSSDFSDRRNLQLVIPTLAFQLARDSSDFRAALLPIIASAPPNIELEPLSIQSQMLLREPLRSTGVAAVIVIDGLDVCIHDDPVSAFLSLLVEMADLPGLKFFVCSRERHLISPSLRVHLVGTYSESHSLYRVSALDQNLDDMGSVCSGTSEPEDLLPLAQSKPPMESRVRSTIQQGERIQCSIDHTWAIHSSPAQTKNKSDVTGPSIAEDLLDPLPKLRAAIGSVLEELGLRLTKAVSEIKHEIKELVDYVERLYIAFVGIEDSTIAVDLTSKLEAISQGLRSMNRGEKKLWTKILKNQDDRNKLASHKQQILDVIQELDSAMKASRDQIERNAKKMQDDKERELLDQLMPVSSARYSSATSCTPGTRVELLDHIKMWATGDLYPEAPIFWLTGTDGTGKSTITSTISAWLHTQHATATFFCSPLDGRDDPRRIFPTISDQLSRRPEFSVFRSSVIQELRVNRAVKEASLEEQLLSLIIRPLKEVHVGSMTIVVIDSLDECKNVEEVYAFLECISRNLHDLPRCFKFFIASRAHDRIRDAFNLFPSSSCREHNLNAVASELVCEDIRIFLSAEFRKFRLEKHGRYTGWPAEEQISGLAEQSDVLFIYASTALKHITSSVDPKSQFQQILNTTSDLPQLTFLYSQIMSSAMFVSEGAQLVAVKHVAAAVTALARQLPITTLARMLSLDEEVLRTVLELFHSVIPVVDNMVRPCHSTWNDFVVSFAREYFNFSLHPFRATLLYRQFESDGTLDDVNKRIACLQEHLALSAPGGLDDPVMLFSALGSANFDRFTRAGRMEDLEEMIKCSRWLLDYHPPGSGNRSISLHNLVFDLRTRYNQGSRVEDLDEAIVVAREMLVKCPTNHAEHWSAMDCTAGALRTRFGIMGNIEDIDEAIALNAKLVEMRPMDHPLYDDTLEHLAGSLHARFDKTRSLETINKVIEYNRRLLDYRPPSHRLYAASLNLFTSALLPRFQMTGQLEDIDKAIESDRKLLEVYPPDHPRHGDSLNALAGALRERYKRTQLVEDIDEAIALNRKLVNLCPPGHPDRSLRLDCLASSIGARFREVQSLENLDEEIQIYQEMFELRPPSHSLHIPCLKSLTAALLTRFTLTKEIGDINVITQLNRQLLGLCPLGHPDHDIRVGCLVSSLNLRYFLTLDDNDLKEEILLTMGHRSRFMLLFWLAVFREKVLRTTKLNLLLINGFQTQRTSVIIVCCAIGLYYIGSVYV